MPAKNLLFFRHQGPGRNPNRMYVLRAREKLTSGRATVLDHLAEEAFFSWI